MVHFFFENTQMRFLIVLIMCVVLAFIDKIHIFQELPMYYFVVGLVTLMIFSNLYNDYGLILLLIAMIALTFNNMKAVTKTKRTSST
jgi:hypothetical protein